MPSVGLEIAPLFPSFPGNTFLINHLYTNPDFKICFWGNPTEDMCSLEPTPLQSSHHVDGTAISEAARFPTSTGPSTLLGSTSSSLFTTPGFLFKTLRKLRPAVRWPLFSPFRLLQPHRPSYKLFGLSLPPQLLHSGKNICSYLYGPCLTMTSS